MPYLAFSKEAKKPFEVAKQRDSTNEERILHFGFIGRLEESKGIMHIIKASGQSSLSNIRWHVFGDGSQANAVYAAQGPNLIWHGAFDSSTGLDKVYGALDAVVLPSRHVEGSPLCLIESLAFGKPWIAFDQGGIRELAPNSNDCVVTKRGDFAGFLEGIRKLSSRLIENQVDSQALRNHYTTYFSPQAVTKKWQALLAAVALEQSKVEYRPLYGP